MTDRPDHVSPDSQAHLLIGRLHDYVLDARRLAEVHARGCSSCFEPKPNEETMILLFYAQPYDISAEGFYFREYDKYSKQADIAKNQYGYKVEEFEIQFIDGGHIDCELAKAWELNQANIERFIAVADDWDNEDKIRFILAVGECSYSFDPDTVNPSDFDVDVYRVDSMRDLAIEFVEEGLFGDIPERFQFYIDYDAIARDLSVDYTEAIIAGERFIYRCG